MSNFDAADIQQTKEGLIVSEFIDKCSNKEVIAKFNRSCDHEKSILKAKILQILVVNEMCHLNKILSIIWLFDHLN